MRKQKQYRRKNGRKNKSLASVILVAIIACGAWFINESGLIGENDVPQVSTVTEDALPAYDGALYAEVNENIPDFSERDMERLSQAGYEYYSALDSLGRAGMVEACVGEETMPTAERESIGMIKPSGWHTVKYDFVDGKYLYNRCHLLGYQLTGENANECNLVTGTRSFNTEGMLPFENEVAEYVKESGNHVAMQVTPVYIDDNLLASGVQMKAKSVEDNGDGVSFNVYVFNAEDGVTIDYATGDSHVEK